MKRVWVSFISIFSIVCFAVPALACGGLFCDGGPQQVNQSAERIIFSANDDGTVTAVVQIFYNGSAREFGWMLPVPGIPEVGLSSNLAFTRLQNASNPQYTMTTTVDGDCDSGSRGLFGGSDSASAGDGAIGGDAPKNGGVSVVGGGSTGPYDYVIIQIAPGDGGAQLGIDWLEQNGYRVPNAGPELIQPYIDDGMNLLAFRLQKSADAGDIRPVVLTYESTRPMIPIKLTAVAANADMGVLVWVLGKERAVPVNYKSLELNDALLNWFNPASNYNAVINRAADEADGQGFVTEHAGPASAFENIIFDQSLAGDWAQLEDTIATDAQSAIRSIWNVVQTLNTTDPNTFEFVSAEGVNEAIDQSFPQMSQMDRDRLRICLENGAQCSQLDGLEDFDAARAYTAFDDFVVGPIIDTQKLFNDADYQTRFYTTMSAADMTLDPIFDFNDTLGEQTNVHQADRTIECSSDVTRSEAPWEAKLPSGFNVRGRGNTWPFTETSELLPANIAIREIGTSGEGEITTDNVVTIRQALDEHNASIKGGCGCTTTPAPISAVWGLLAIGLLGLRRRRR